MGNPHSFSMSYTHIDHIKRVYFWPSSVFILLSSLFPSPSLTLPPHLPIHSAPVANKGEQSDTTVWIIGVVFLRAVSVSQIQIFVHHFRPFSPEKI